MKVNLRGTLIFFGPVLALHYCWAANRDENNGFPLTAAMEWRHAAELSSWITPLANWYWREWERLMQLSRRFAGPIGQTPVAPSDVLWDSVPNKWSRNIGLGYHGVKSPC